VHGGDPRHHALHSVLKTTELHRADKPIAGLAADALRRSGTDDAVDAIAAATAVAIGAPIVTSAPYDLMRLVEALDSPKHPTVNVSASEA
jgi:hypothetical protein